MEYNEMLNALESMSDISADGIIYKQIPDLLGSGIPDPRVKANRAKQMERKKNNPPEKTFNVAAARAAMGWPNLDVTKGAVSTEYAAVSGINGDIPVRIYKPAGNTPKPCIVFFHGGGFFGGSLDCVENPCKCIAHNADCVVVSVNYGLAPEHPFPQGFEDCFAVVKDIYNSAGKYGVDSSKIGVCGDSAGGNLAAVCSVRDRNEKAGMIKFTALLYPVVDVGAHGNGLYNWSMSKYDILADEAVIKDAVTEIGKDTDEKLLTKLYLQGDATLEKDEYVSPLFTKSAAGLPPTLMITAEYDYLRVQGEAYAKMLKDAGVTVKTIRYKGMDHAFMDKIGEYPQAEDAMREISKMFTEVI